MKIGIGIGIGHRSRGGADVTPPVLSSVQITGPDLSGIMSEPGKVYMIWETVSTPRTNAYVKAAALAHSAALDYTWTGLGLGANAVTVNDSGLASGTYYIKLAPEDLAGNIDGAATAAQVTEVIGAPFTLINSAVVATPGASLVVTIPSSGTFIIPVTWAKASPAATITSVTGSTGITASVPTSGTLGETGAISVSTTRNNITWIQVDATQSGTVTLALTSAPTYQAWALVQLAPLSWASRSGVTGTTGGLLTTGTSHSLALASLPAKSLLMLAALKNESTAGGVTLSNAMAPGDLLVEFPKASTPDYAFSLAMKAGQSGSPTVGLAYTPLGYILDSFIAVTLN